MHVRGIFARRVDVQRCVARVVWIVVARIIDRTSKWVDNHAIRFVASSLVFRARETTLDECRATYTTTKAANAVYDVWARYRLEVTGRGSLAEHLKARKARADGETCEVGKACE